MNNIYNIYCDESCHLENDKQAIMLLGCLWCPENTVKERTSELLEIMDKYNAKGELKWIKVSVSRESFYFELIDWFFKHQDVNFRAWIVSNKLLLNHTLFNQGSHDIFYYKMYFSLLNKILSPDNKYNIYLDVKDTRSRYKVRELKKILCNNQYDFTGQMIKHIQNIHSYESVLMQMTDFLLGAVTYANRGLNTNPTKIAIISKIEQNLGYSLTKSTSLLKNKINLFIFSPRNS